MALELKGIHFGGRGRSFGTDRDPVTSNRYTHTNTHRSCYFIIRIIIGKLYLGFREKEEKAKASKFYQT